MSSQIIIDKVVMDLYADQAITGKSDVDRYLKSVKEVILPMVGSQLENQLDNSKDIVIEQLEISVSQFLDTNWQQATSAEIANEISLAVEQQLFDQQVDKDLIIDQKESKELTAFEKYLFFNGGEPSSVNESELVNISITKRAVFSKLKSKYGYLPIGKILKLPIAVIEEVMKEFGDFPLRSLLEAIKNQMIKRLIFASVLMVDTGNQPFDIEKWRSMLVDLLMQDVAHKTVLESERLILGDAHVQEFEEIFQLYDDQLKAIAGQDNFKTQETKVSHEVLQLIEALENSIQLSDYAKKWFAQSFKSIAKKEILSFQDWLHLLFVKRPGSIMMKECSEWSLNGQFSGEVLINIKQLKEVIEKASSNQSNKRSSELSESQSVANGGLVLLHPFLPQLFRSCQLMDEKSQWVDQQAQVEAIYLLHFIANGEIDDLSADFMVEKLLTGCELMTDIADQPPSDPLFVYAEKPMEEMLQAIQLYWPPMKNNSWTSLRRDFLMREAILEGIPDENPVIKVLPHTLDVLIPYIKWGLTMVRYSWMDKMMKIEWGKE